MNDMERNYKVVDDMIGQMNNMIHVLYNLEHISDDLNTNDMLKAINNARRHINGAQEYLSDISATLCEYIEKYMEESE